MTFELITTTLNLFAILGLLILSMIILQNKFDIQERHRQLNKRLDELLILTQRLEEDDLILKEKTKILAEKTEDAVRRKTEPKKNS